MSLHYCLRFFTLVNSHTFSLEKHLILQFKQLLRKSLKAYPESTGQSVAGRLACTELTLLLQSAFSIRWSPLSHLCGSRLPDFHGSIFLQHCFSKFLMTFPNYWRYICETSNINFLSSSKNYSVPDTGEGIFCWMCKWNVSHDLWSCCHDVWVFFNYVIIINFRTHIWNN